MITLALHQEGGGCYSEVNKLNGAEVMCLGIPMQVKSIEGVTARCESGGVEREVNLFMLQEEPVVVGDYVMVHIGYAIQKVAPEEARSAWDVYDEMMTSDDA